MNKETINAEPVSAFLSTALLDIGGWVSLVAVCLFIVWAFVEGYSFTVSVKRLKRTLKSLLFSLGVRWRCAACIFGRFRADIGFSFRRLFAGFSSVFFAHRWVLFGVDRVSVSNDQGEGRAVSGPATTKKDNQ